MAKARTKATTILLAGMAEESATAVGDTLQAMRSIAEKISIMEEISYQTILPAELVPAIGMTADLVQEVRSASDEQSSGVGQITGAMSRVAQRNASAAEDLASTA